MNCDCGNCELRAKGIAVPRCNDDMREGALMAEQRIVTGLEAIHGRVLVGGEPFVKLDRALDVVKGDNWKPQPSHIEAAAMRLVDALSTRCPDLNTLLLQEALGEDALDELIEAVKAARA